MQIVEKTPQFARHPYDYIYIVPLLIFSDVFKKFLEENFDAKAHATRVIQGHAISQQLAKLADGINLLDKELHSQVCTFVHTNICNICI